MSDTVRRWQFVKRPDKQFGGWVNCRCGQCLLAITEQSIKKHWFEDARCPRCGIYSKFEAVNLGEVGELSGDKEKFFSLYLQSPINPPQRPAKKSA